MAGEPRTEAGKAYVAYERNDDDEAFRAIFGAHPEIGAIVAQIEAEAATPSTPGLRKALDVLAETDTTEGAPDPRLAVDSLVSSDPEAPR